MLKFGKIESPVAVLDRDDVDTDQIIPARFLRTTERTGLGQHLFEDWRYDGNGHPRAGFVLNTPEGDESRIMLAGRNFGCGSSREHAVWALMDFGIAVVIAEGFADIFRKNALRNGLLTVSVDPDDHARCLAAARKRKKFAVDLGTCSMSLGPQTRISFDIDPFSRTCMLDGVDELEYILRHEGEIRAFEDAREIR